MRLVRFNRLDEPLTAARLGLLLDDERIVDLRAAAVLCFIAEDGDGQARQRAALRFAPHVGDFLAIGRPAWTELDKVRTWLFRHGLRAGDAVGLDGERLFTPVDGSRLHAAVRPARIIVIDHVRAARGQAVASSIRTCRVKLGTSVVGPVRDIEIPPGADRLRGCLRLGIVIGEQCRLVPARKAFDVVAGYTIVVDLQVPGSGGRDPLAGHMDATTVVGPWLATVADIDEPGRLRVTVTVGTVTRQDGPFGGGRQAIAELIRCASRITLEPGDVIAIGGGGTDFTVRAGDVLACRVDRLGTVRNTVRPGPAPTAQRNGH